MEGLSEFFQIGADHLALGAIISAFFLATIVERMSPARAASDDDRRLLVNFGLGLVGFVLALVPMVAPLSVAHLAQSQQFGLLPGGLAHGWSGYGIALIALSLTAYAIHRLMHAVPLLWSIHRLHHSDAVLDFSTGFRTHPLEYAASLLAASAVVALLGLGVDATLMALVTMQLLDLLSHMNVQLSPRIDALLSPLFATPAAHARHHSVRRDEHDSNFGNGILVWDHLFGTFSGTAAPAALGLTHTQRSNA